MLRRYCKRPLSGQQTVDVREVTRLGSICHIQLPVDIPEVELHSLLGNPELARNVAIGRPSRHQLQDFELTARERQVTAGDRLSLVPIRRGSSGEAVEDMAAEGLAQKGGECRRIRSFRDGARRPGIKNAIEPFGIHLDAQEYHSDLLVLELERTNELERVLRAPHHVEQNNIRPCADDRGR